MDTSDLVAGLNPEQQAAVTAGEGPLLVLAGAGSGKTRVLTRRLAWLIAQGTPPQRVLAITFTNKAAREMQERVEALLGPAARSLWVHTFHAACVRILRQDAHRLGYAPGFTILDADDQRTAVRECLREMNLSEKAFPPNAVLARISGAKNLLAGPGRGFASDRWSQQVRAVAERYQEKLRSANAFDFDDLIAAVVRLLESPAESPDDPAARWPEHFRHVLVDEYQDTNHAQYRLVRALAARHRSLTVVGDEDQSIYAFRGADHENILRFESDFPDARVVRLERNYRSTQRILDAAGGVIARNARKYPKRLWTEAGPGEPVVVYRAWDEHDEAAFVVREIESLRAQSGRGWGEFAVLYRTHAQSRLVEETLLARSIPYAVVGGLKFYQRKEIKDILAWLRLVANPSDRVAFQRAVQAPRRGVGPATLDKLRAHMDATGESLGSALERAGEIAGRQGRLLEGMADALSELRRVRDEAGLFELVSATLDRTGYRAELEADGGIEARTRLENLGELLSLAKKLGPHMNLDEFLAQASLLAEQDAYDERQEAVTLMTLHAAKGLEFPVVFLVGMEEGIFPHMRSLDGGSAAGAGAGAAGGLDEERRLCYVGMTRARERLYLTCAHERTLYGLTQRSRPSRFLDEVDPAAVREVGAQAPTRWDGVWSRPRPAAAASSGAGPAASGAGPAAGLAAGSSAGAPAPGDCAFEAGERVVHPRWGAGTVVSARGRGPEAEVTVSFPDAGVRTLIAGYANLRREA
jgi:DNA helicase-2/ATP-dependent DNA helicase PcrA